MTMIKLAKRVWHAIFDEEDGDELILLIDLYIYMAITIAAFIIHFARGGGI
jgi:hypothetical protein